MIPRRIPKIIKSRDEFQHILMSPSFLLITLALIINQLVSLPSTFPMLVKSFVMVFYSKTIYINKTVIYIYIYIYVLFYLYIYIYK